MSNLKKLFFLALALTMSFATYAQQTQLTVTPGIVKDEGSLKNEVVGLTQNVSVLTSNNPNFRIKVNFSSREGFSAADVIAEGSLGTLDYIVEFNNEQYAFDITTAEFNDQGALEMDLVLQTPKNSLLIFPSVNGTITKGTDYFNLRTVDAASSQDDKWAVHNHNQHVIDFWMAQGYKIVVNGQELEINYDKVPSITTYTLFDSEGNEIPAGSQLPADQDTDDFTLNINGVDVPVSRGSTITIPQDTNTDTDDFTLVIDGVNVPVARGAVITIPQNTDTDDFTLVINGQNIPVNRGSVVTIPTYELNDADGNPIASGSNLPADADTDDFTLNINGVDVPVSRGSTITIPVNTDTDDFTLVVDGVNTPVSRGSVITIPKYQLNDADGNPIASGSNLPTDIDTDDFTLNINGVDVPVSRGSTITIPPDTNTDTDDFTLVIDGVNTPVSRGSVITIPQNTDTDDFTLVIDGQNTPVNRGSVITIPKYELNDAAGNPIASGSNLPSDLDTDDFTLNINGVDVPVARGSTITIPVNTDTDDFTLVVDGVNTPVARGSVITIPKYQLNDAGGNPIASGSNLPADSDTDDFTLNINGVDVPVSRGSVITIPPDTNTDTDDFTLVIEGVNTPISRGSVITIPKYQLNDADGNPITSGSNLPADNDTDNFTLNIEGVDVPVIRGSNVTIPLNTDIDRFYTKAGETLTEINRDGVIEMPVVTQYLSLDGAKVNLMGTDGITATRVAGGVEIFVPADGRIAELMNVEYASDEANYLAGSVSNAFFVKVTHEDTTVKWSSTPTALQYNAGSNVNAGNSPIKMFGTSNEDWELHALEGGLTIYAFNELGTRTAPDGGVIFF